MGKPKERRVRTQHPGVKLLKRKRATKTVWLARWFDPVTGKAQEVSLNRLGKKSSKSRVKWAKDKSAEIQAVRAARKGGKTVQTPVDKAFKEVLDAGLQEWRSNTYDLYDRARRLFEEWCAKQGIKFIQDITAAHLSQFRAALIIQPKREPRRQGKRGQRVANGKLRSPRSNNTLINSTRALLSHLRRRDLTPHLTGEIIIDRLPFMRTDRPLPKFFKVDQIKALMAAVDKHDSELDDGLGHHRYPIGDFVRLVLLTGLRRAEAVKLQWTDIDFSEQLIRLPHPAGKGGISRLITLAETPSLLTLLRTRKKNAGGADPWVFSVTHTNGNRIRYEQLTVDTVEERRKCIRDDYGFHFGWHDLRRTCGTFLANAAGIYGSASVFKTAARLGHTVQVAQQRYYGQTSVWEGARTLEQAMGLEPMPKRIDQAVSEIVANVD